MSITCVVGLNWGDEGKGRMTDYLASDADIVARYQGGNNAGHTVINGHGTFKLHLVPSGIFSPTTMNLLGPGMVIDLEGLVDELASLEASGISVENVRVSERATICFPFHRLEDGMEEDRLGARLYGSTRRGIAPAYSDRYVKKAIQVGELRDVSSLESRLADIVEWKNLTLTPRGHTVSLDEMLEWARDYGEVVRPLIGDTCRMVGIAARDGKRIIFEGQLGALRDVYFGTYPFTSSSGCLSPYAMIGPGLSGRQPDEVLGVMKAFSTCVGEGAFVTEMSPGEASELREISYEYAAATGRPRRIGHFDVVASRYGVELQAPTTVALTKLDSLSGRDSLLICTAYEVDGTRLEDFPLNAQLKRVKPHYEKMPGWEQDIARVRHYNDLPANARSYVQAIEDHVGCYIRYISVGPERESLIVRDRA